MGLLTVYDSQNDWSHGIHNKWGSYLIYGYILTLDQTVFDVCFYNTLLDYAMGRKWYINSSRTGHVRMLGRDFMVTAHADVKRDLTNVFV